MHGTFGAIFNESSSFWGKLSSDEDDKVKNITMETKSKGITGEKMGKVTNRREQLCPNSGQRTGRVSENLRMKKGFTLIELLVVIAIIGILAAIIFPVFARAKVAAYKSSDMSNMNAIRTAIQLYRTDQGGYPPALLGYTTLYNGLYSGASLVPANQLAAALYPKRVDSLETLRPALDRGTDSNFNSAVTEAVWPTKAGLQKYGPSDGPVLGCDPFYKVTAPREYYKLSGYDVATVPDGQGGNRTELHYTPFWSIYTVATDPCNPLPSEQGSVSDSTRQLGYSDPPDSTVVTWDSFFRDYVDGVPTRTKSDVVLFLGGSARPYDSQAVVAQSWQVTP